MDEDSEGQGVRLDTPRKSGSFKTPPKQDLKRKKVARPETWKKNVRKALRLQGKQYFSENGQLVRAKQVKDIDCSQCKMKCNRLKDRQEEIFETFYSLPSYESQKMYVTAHVTQKDTRTYHNVELNEGYDKTRNVCRQYFLTEDGQRERVCKKFFQATLSISHNYVQHALTRSKDGAFLGTESRGKGTSHNAASSAAVERVKAHIRSFPTVPSHYTRRDTKREYLAPDLNIRKMWQLYVEECQDGGEKHLSERQYRSIFNNNFNFSFHVPKKDQCATCDRYETKRKEGTLSEVDKKDK